MPLRTICTNNVLAYQNATGAIFAGTWFAVIFGTFSWISIEPFFACLTVVTNRVVLAIANTCHWITRLRVAITLAGNTPKNKEGVRVSCPVKKELQKLHMEGFVNLRHFSQSSLTDLSCHMESLMQLPSVPFSTDVKKQILIQ